MSFTFENAPLYVVIPGCFSVMAAVMISLTIVMFKKLRTLTFELVALQSISEMIFNLSIITFWNPPGKHVYFSDIKCVHYHSSSWKLAVQISRFKKICLLLSLLIIM